MSDRPPDLGLLARQQRQIIDEMAQMRDDMRIMSAMIMRIDSTLAGLLTELRHAQPV
jgi:hypothetical protein